MNKIFCFILNKGHLSLIYCFLFDCQWVKIEQFGAVLQYHIFPNKGTNLFKSTYSPLAFSPIQFDVSKFDIVRISGKLGISKQIQYILNLFLEMIDCIPQVSINPLSLKAAKTVLSAIGLESFNNGTSGPKIADSRVCMVREEASRK